MSTQPSTFEVRNLAVDKPQLIPFVYVKGQYPFPVVPLPYNAQHKGAYRAELDLVEHTATIREVTS